MATYGGDGNCARVHLTCLCNVALMKLMEIEPLKALSSFCSGGQLMPTQTKTKPSQPVSLPFIIVRTTAAALPVSPQNPPSACVCECVFLRIPQPHTVYFTKEAIYYDVREIKLGEREANTRRCWKEANFILAENGWPEGRRCFCIPDARGKIGCRLAFYVNIREDDGGVPVHG